MPILTPKQAIEMGRRGELHFTEAQDRAWARLIMAIVRKDSEMRGREQAAENKKAAS